MNRQVLACRTLRPKWLRCRRTEARKRNGRGLPGPQNSSGKRSYRMAFGEAAELLPGDETARGLRPYTKHVIEEDLKESGESETPPKAG